MYDNKFIASLFEMTDNAKIAESMIDYTIQNLHGSPKLSGSESTFLFNVNGLSVSIAIYYISSSVFISANFEKRTISLQIDDSLKDFSIMLKKNGVRQYFYESEDLTKRAKFLSDNFVKILTGK